MTDATVAGPSRLGAPPAKQILTQILRPASDLKGKRKAATLASCIRSSQDVTPSEHYEARVEGRKLQLSNPDRPRPKAPKGSVADEKLRRRDARVSDRVKRLRRVKGMPREKAVKVAAAERKRTALSRSQRKRLGLEGIDESASYETLQPLHRLWTGYMHQLLSIVDAQGKPSPVLVASVDGEATWSLSRSAIQRMQGEVQKADLCGASVRVVAAGNPSLVGMEGLVVRETENTFIVAPRSGAKAKTIPKHNLSLSLSIPLPPLSEGPASTTSSPSLEFKLHGNQMSYTMAFRATRKFKQKTSIHF